MRRRTWQELACGCTREPSQVKTSKAKQSETCQVETWTFDLEGNLCCTLTMYVMTYRRLGIESRQRKKRKYQSIIDDWATLRDRDGVSLLAARDCTRDGGESCAVL